MELKLETLRRAVEKLSDDVPMLFQYARSFEEALAFGDAREIYEKILDREPANARARFGLARVLFFEGRTSESAVRVEAVLKEAPDFAEALLFMGRIHLSENNEKLAAECVLRARSVDPEVRDQALEKRLRSAMGKAAREEEARSPFTWKRAADDWTAEADWGDGGGEVESPFELFAEDEDFEDADGAGYEDGGFIDALETGLSLTDFERPELSFRDVGGLGALKEAMRMQLLYPLKNKKLFRAYGREAGGSVLLYGPPGCGKTLAARATAGELEASFLSVQGYQLLDRTHGYSEKALHEIFEAARSQKAPSVLFFDDVDALALSRDICRGEQGHGILNQFLAELDMQERERSGLLVICATSAPWRLDAAFRRKGRFDTSVFVGLPDRTERAEIAKVLARSKPFVEMNAARVAARTRGFTGSEMRAMFDRASEEVLREVLKSQSVIPLRTRDLIAVAKRISPAASSWFETLKKRLDDRVPGLRRSEDILAHLR